MINPLETEYSGVDDSPFDKQLSLWFNVLEEERKKLPDFSNVGIDKMENYNRLLYAQSMYNNSKIFYIMHTTSLNSYVSDILHARRPGGNFSYFNVHYDSELRDYVIERVGKNIGIKRSFNIINGYELPVLPVSNDFLWKRQIVYNKMRNNFKMRRKVYQKLFGSKLGNVLSKVITYAEVFVRTKLVHVPWYQKVSWKRSINFVFNFSTK
jgi:hypothetical protein